MKNPNSGRFVAVITPGTLKTPYSDLNSESASTLSALEFIAVSPRHLRRRYTGHIEEKAFALGNERQ